jgi:hypothetical protein
MCVPFGGCSLRDDVIGVVRAWLSGQVVVPQRKLNQHKHWNWSLSDREEPTYLGVVDEPATFAVSRRSLAVAHRAAQRLPRPLWSAPTHRGGWIDPLVLVQRLVAWQKLGEEPPAIDAALALLRLAPDNRQQALKQLGKQPGEFADAVRYALGGEAKIGKSAALWVAAARARNPLADDPAVEKRFPGLGPDAGTAARHAWKFKADPWKHDDQSGVHYRFQLTTTPPEPKTIVGEFVDSELVSMLMHHKSRYHGEGLGVEDVRWSASWWPAGSEAHFAAGARYLADNLDWWSAEWANKTYLESLLDADAPLGEMGTLVLCLGLSAKEPGEHTLAADALAAAISDGRVDGRCLAPTMARLLTTAGVKPGRWAKVFASVARISPLHAHVVRLTLENTLAEAGKGLADPPQDLHHLLELLTELLAECGAAMTSSAARETLERLRGSGKAGKAAKAVLAAAPEQDAARDQEIAAAAIQGRLKRARRWSERM